MYVDEAGEFTHHSTNQTICCDVMLYENDC